MRRSPPFRLPVWGILLAMAWAGTTQAQPEATPATTAAGDDGGQGAVSEPVEDSAGAAGALPDPARRAGAADTAAAEALFQMGRSLMDSGEIAQACEKFAASMRAEPAGGTMLNLALCHQLQGKLASAWAEYRKASELILAAGQKERADEAMRLAVDLEPKLAKLTVAVQQQVPGQRVSRNGRPLDPGVQGVAVPVDPGVYRIEASAPGYRSWSSTVTVAGEGDRKSVTVPRLEPLASGSSSGDEADSGGPAGGAQYRVPYYAGAIMAGIGAAAVGVGAVLGGVAAAQVHDAESDPTLCGADKLCTPEGQDVIDGARSKATAATLLIGVGAATVVSGFVMVLTTGTFRVDPADDGPESATQAVRWGPSFGPGHGGAVLTGWF